MTPLQFITAIPLDVRLGSGCYVGTRTLVEALRAGGLGVEMITPRVFVPVYTATRLIFNETLRWRRFSGCATVGIDLDGYTVPRGPGSPPHIACIKGVLGDAVRFESGPTRASLALQSRLEAKHARRADLAITISRYCAGRMEELYGVKGAVVVPELIDLKRWRRLFQENPGTPHPDKFTVLCVCRFYPRKRVHILLQAAALLRQSIPELNIRIVGNGPEFVRLRTMTRSLNLDAVVQWVGNASIDALAREYNRAHVFCLPSVQEGFGIVFLEAMAAGRPIVAARSAAVPEVVTDGLLVEPENPEALADALLQLYSDRELCRSLASAGHRNVERFEMHRVAKQFLSEVAKVAPKLDWTGKIE